MSTINLLVTAICSLAQCFPNLDVDLTLREGFLPTVDLYLGSNQTLTVSLDIASDSTWVFGSYNNIAALKKDIGNNVFDLSNDKLVYARKNATSTLATYQKPIYEDDFNVSLQMARTTVFVSGNDLGIPQMGVVSRNVTAHLSYLVGGSGVLGLQKDAYANGVSYSSGSKSVLLFRTPTYGKTVGQIKTGRNASIPQCASRFLDFDLVSTASFDGSAREYIAFNSTLNHKTIVLSTMTSYITVDADTFAGIERALKPVWDSRDLTVGANLPVRKHKLVPCGLVRDAPALRFGSSERPLSLNGTDYVKRTVRQSDDADRWVVGYPFLQKYCVKIDFAEQTVSFGDSNQVAGQSSDKDY